MKEGGVSEDVTPVFESLCYITGRQNCYMNTPLNIDKNNTGENNNNNSNNNNNNEIENVSEDNNCEKPIT
jgi:hypothetical protein